MRRSELRVHAFLPYSHANGPGLRCVLWVQGCTLGCPGCYNPDTHSLANGSLVGVDTLFEQIQALQGQVEGLTVSGGEPLQQARPLAALLQRLRVETSLSILVFTGFNMPEIERVPETEAILASIDVLIAGRYQAELRLARDLRGSSNKTVYFLTKRYTPQDLEKVPHTEAIITPQGEILITGIDGAADA